MTRSTDPLPPTPPEDLAERGLEERGRRGPVARKRMRIEDWVRIGVSTSVLKPGDRLPDRTAVAARFGVTVATAQKAFDALRAGGFIVASRGHGTRIASPPPFAGRYLLVVCGRNGVVSESLFDQALCKAAKEVSAKLGVSFETLPALDEPGTETMRNVAARARQQTYAGVFLRTIDPARRRCGPLLRLNHVPISGFFQTDGTEGALVHPLRNIRGDDLTPLFAACAHAGRRRVAAFLNCNTAGAPDVETYARSLARSLGVTIGPWHYHDFNMAVFRPAALERILRAVFAADGAWCPDAIVMGDDNLVPTVTRFLVERFGHERASRFLLVAHGNHPCLPETA